MHLLKANAMRSNAVNGNGSLCIRRLCGSWVKDDEVSSSDLQLAAFYPKAPE